MPVHQDVHLHVVDYTEENVADALITGLSDPEIKQGLLGEPNQPLTMERAMLYAESKEAAKTSVSQLDPGTSVGALKSRYKKLPRVGRPQPEHNNFDEDERCYFCGRTGHGKYPPSEVQSARHSATRADDVGRQTTPTRCADQNHTHHRLWRMPYLTLFVMSRPTGQRDVTHWITMYSTPSPTDG